MREILGFDLNEPAEEAGFADKFSAGAVIGMTILLHREKDDLGLVFADDFDDFQFIRAVNFDEAIGESEVIADGQAHELRGGGGFPSADIRGAAGAKFAAGEVDYSDLITLFYMFDDSAGYGDFHIVRVSAEG